MQNTAHLVHNIYKLHLVVLYEYFMEWLILHGMCDKSEMFVLHLENDATMK